MRDHSPANDVYSISDSGERQKRLRCGQRNQKGQDREAEENRSPPNQTWCRKFRARRINVTTYARQSLMKNLFGLAREFKFEGDISKASTPACLVARLGCRA